MKLILPQVPTLPSQDKDFKISRMKYLASILYDADKSQLFHAQMRRIRIPDRCAFLLQ